jgi:AcrR family transcriptional regulator
LPDNSALPSGNGRILLFFTEAEGPMAGRPIDRRVARKQALLHDALISLIPRKGYEAITVEQICAAANVGRSTFYAHYTGKDDLLRHGFRHLHRALANRQKGSAEKGQDTEYPLGFSLVMFEHAKAHIEHYKAHTGDRAGAIAHDSIRRLLTDLVRSEVGRTSRRRSRGSVEGEIAVQYLVGAYLGVLTWWLDNGAKLPIAEVDLLFRRLALEGVAPWLKPRGAAD